MTTLTTLETLRDALIAHSNDYDWAELPTFGGSEPARTEGVWSWDADRLLVGECANDLRIVRRDEYLAEIA